ncbi:MAG TPA: dihydrofolate reductase family protein [Thermoleophilaceae bacterium]|nr:dihydrofolate reductase family protein [Thermoleophilaceae bacterium]
MDLQRLYPDPLTVRVAEAAASVCKEGPATADRPCLALNFAATADGRITIGGRSGPIGNEADRELFHELRASVDAVMAGATTVATERYGRLIRDEARRERRRAAGMDPDPLAIVVSARLSLDADVPLLQDPDSRVVIVTESERELEGVRARVEYLRPGDAPAEPEELRDRASLLALFPVMRTLRERYGLDSVMCEGGSVLAGALMREHLVDELCLSVAPKVAAGSGPTVVGGPPLDPPAEMELRTVHEAGGHLFLRYRVPG